MSYLHHPLMLKATIRSYFHVHRTARWLQEQRFSPSPLTPRRKGILSLFAGSVVREATRPLPGPLDLEEDE